MLLPMMSPDLNFWANDIIGSNISRANKNSFLFIMFRLL